MLRPAPVCVLIVLEVLMAVVNCRILYGRYAANIHIYHYYYSITLSLSFQAENLPFLQILPVVGFFLLQD